MQKELGNRRAKRDIIETPTDDPRVGKVCRVVHTTIKFQKVIRSFKINNKWQLFEVENEDGSTDIVNEYQLKGEVDKFAGV